MRVPQPLKVIGRAGALIQPPIIADAESFRALRRFVLDEPSPALLDGQPPPPLRPWIDHRSSSSVGISIPAHASSGFALGGRAGPSGWLGGVRRCSAITACLTA